MKLVEKVLVNSPVRVLAVDPGKSGAVCLLGGGIFEVRRDFTTLQEVAHGIEDLKIESQLPGLLVMEFVHAFPGQGVCSVWSFGRAAGVADGALAICFPDQPVHEVAPQKWQNYFKGELGIAKETEFDSREICLTMFPSYGHLFKRKKDHNTADAVLIAVWQLCHLPSVACLPPV